MASLAAQILQQAAPVDEPIPSFDPAPLTPDAVLSSARRAEIDNEDPWEAAQRISEIAADPQKMQTLLNNIASDFDEHAPQTAMDARIATARAVGFLASKAPKASVYAPGMPDTKPTQAELNKWSRYLAAVKDPTSVLDDAMNGTLTAEGLDAVRAVYPQTYSQMQVLIADQVNNAPNIPYHRKIQLSALLGQDMSGTINRIGMMAQGVYGSSGQPAAPSGAGGQVPVSRIKDMGVAGRAGKETAAWREAQRGIGAWNRSNR